MIDLERLLFVCNHVVGCTALCAVAGALVSAEDAKYSTALRKAVAKMHLSVAKTLIYFRANINRFVSAAVRRCYCY